MKRLARSFAGPSERHAGELLRHEYPFRFIERFGALEGGGAEAHPRVPGIWPTWASAFARTSLPIEWAAQLYGARHRSSEEHEARAGYLAGVKQFRWAHRPVSIVRARVVPIARHGAFHEFTATFFTGSGAGCAWMAGMLHLSDRSVPTPPPARRTNGNAAIREPAVDTGAFRVLSDHTLGNERWRRLEPNPDCSVYGGHFPGDPITPGVLLLEAMIESGCALVEDATPERLYLAGVQDVVFQSLARPGDELLFRVRKRLGEGAVHEFRGSVLCGKKRVARAKFSLGVLDHDARISEEV